MQSQSFHYGASKRSSENTDFNDVFGGPPRRFSSQEVRARRRLFRTEEEDSDSDEEKSLMPTRCLNEVPNSMSRRHNLGEDFFTDIFRGDESFSSPRSNFNGDSATASSRFMSPARISTPKPDHSYSPLPNSSITAKMAKTVEVTGGRFVQGYEDDNVLFHKEPLSRTESRDDDIEHNFHFSFYKWAGNGIPLLKLMPILVGNNGFTSTKAVSSPARPQEEARKLQDLFRETLDVVNDVETRHDAVETSGIKNDNNGANDMRNVDDVRTIRKSNRMEDDDSSKIENTKCDEEEKYSLYSITKGASASDTLRQDTMISPERDIDAFDVNFMVEVLSDDPENSASTETLEDTKAIDAKIRKWSAGKKGNIHSLLSTLQLVLWPGSGWKAIPLVDLIEGNSVKRAYQRALLHLHPDKLQQKRADFHQIYLAQKVFDIIQEAWEHYNTLAHV